MKNKIIKISVLINIFLFTSCSSQYIVSEIEYDTEKINIYTTKGKYFNINDSCWCVSGLSIGDTIIIKNNKLYR